MDKEPETYQELITKKLCYELTNEYQIKKGDLDKIYYFLLKNENAVVVGDGHNINLQIGNKIVDVIRIPFTSLNKVVIKNNNIKIYKTPIKNGSNTSSSSGGGFWSDWSSSDRTSGSSSSVGRSSNNNNNNNNNN